MLSEIGQVIIVEMKSITNSFVEPANMLAALIENF